MASLRELLPSREWYVGRLHPGTDIWWHSRTALTPAYPAWRAEGSACPGERIEDEETGEVTYAGCPGRRVPYKAGPDDHGLTTPAELAECGMENTPDAYAGNWVCDGPRQGGSGWHQGAIAMSEVKSHQNDEPAAAEGDNVVPLFGVGTT